MGTLVKILAELGLSVALAAVSTVVAFRFLPTRSVVAVVPTEATGLARPVTFVSLTVFVLGQWVACDFDV